VLGAIEMVENPIPSMLSDVAVPYNAITNKAITNRVRIIFVGTDLLKKYFFDNQERCTEEGQETRDEAKD
jgi:hypothetical protein